MRIALAVTGCIGAYKAAFLLRLLQESGADVRVAMTASAERFVGLYQALPRTIRQRVFEPLVHALPYEYRRIKTAVATFALEDRQARMIRWFGAASDDELDRLLVPELGAGPVGQALRV